VVHIPGNICDRDDNAPTVWVSRIFVWCCEYSVVKITCIGAVYGDEGQGPKVVSSVQIDRDRTFRLFQGTGWEFDRQSMCVNGNEADRSRVFGGADPLQDTSALCSATT
jgi:hypothetical protein